MSLISNGIDSVRAFVLPVGIWPDGQCFLAPRMALVRWRSVFQDMYYQVYSNGRYAGTTLDTQQRQMIVPVPTSLNSPICIEVFAVMPQDADIDFSKELEDSLNESGRVRLTLLRSQDLPFGATAQIYFDNGTGDIDYDTPLNDSPIRLWPAWQDKAGFGMSRFGASDFGYDSAAAVGFGKGSFGNDRFGIGADTIYWTSPVLQAGVFKFSVVVSDDKGNQSSFTESEPVTVTPAAEPAQSLEISSFDKQTNELVLTIT